MGVARKLLGLSRFDEVEIARQVLRRRNGVLVDVGAHHGTSLLPFAQAGWTVHAFEPDASNREILLYAISGFENVTISPCAVSDDPGTTTLFRSSVSSGISSLSAFHSSHQAAGTVPVTTLEEYFDEKRINSVDLLKIDTEGHDLFVLLGIPWHSLKPEVIVCEFEDRKTEPLGYTFEDLAQYLSDHGYRVFVSEWYPIVEYGQQHRWRKIQPWPCQLHDAKAWGNLIAVPQRLKRRTQAILTLSSIRLQLRRFTKRLAQIRTAS